jgi:hypothetical protein
MPLLVSREQVTPNESLLAPIYIAHKYTGGIVYVPLLNT